jgi:hypothetical protein
MKAKPALHVVAMAAALLSCLTFGIPAYADVKVSGPHHVRLGFEAGFPVNDMRADSVTCVSYSATITGMGTLAIDMGADITFSYDRADVVPGGSIPIQVTLHPTNDLARKPPSGRRPT